MKFRLEQLALCVPDPEAARRLLSEIGAAEWVQDTVTAEGEVFGEQGRNVASLSFEYDMLEDAHELEILHYTSGANWMAGRAPAASHIGMHCTMEELARWREFFSDRGIRVAQEVNTLSHTNPAIRDTRRYTYVIFDTRSILGIDLKFIVRRPA